MRLRKISLRTAQKIGSHTYSLPPREGESEEEQNQRLTEAQAALESGTEFADVARKYSDDFGSADAGGDLGFSAGEAFPLEMEEAITDLEVNALSEVVETDAGLHLIMVTERREGNPPTLAEMRSELEAEIQSGEAKIELLAIVEDLRDLSFNAENLSAPAEELGLTVSRSEGITRSPQKGLFTRPLLLEAAFSEEVLEGGLNSEVIELDSGHFVVLRVIRHNEPEVEALEAVTDRIAGIMRVEIAREAVKHAAEQAVLSLRAGQRVEEYANSRGYAWQVELGARRRNANVPPEVLHRAFQLPDPGEGSTLVDYVISGHGDALVVELDRVVVGEYGALPQREQAVLEQQLTSEYAGMLDSEYRAGLRSSADVQVM